MAAAGLPSPSEEGTTILESGRLPNATGAAGAAASSDCYSLPDIATTEQLLDDLGGYAITLWVVVGLVVLLLYGLLARTIWLVYQDEHTPKPWRANVIWVNSVYPFVSLMCLASLIVPASDDLLNAIGVIYLSVAVSKFVDLCMLYFGGESQLLSSVGATDVPLASPPLCCCCRPCCPRRTITKRSVRVLKLLVHQLPFSQSGYFFFALFLYSARVLEVGEVSDDPVAFILTLLNAASFLLGMYGLSMLEVTTKGKLTQLRYQRKFSVIKSTLTIIKLQEFIFNIAISNGGVACTPSMSPKVYGAFIQNIVIAVEMPMLGLLSFWLYRPDAKPPGDTAEEQQSNTNSGQLNHGLTDSGQLNPDTNNGSTAEWHSSQPSGTAANPVAQQPTQWHSSITTAQQP